MMLPLAVLVSFLLSGCAGSHGVNRDAMRSALHHDAVRTNDADASSLPTGKSALPIPFHLGLFFVQQDFPANGVVYKADWVTADKQAILNALAPLRDERIVSEIFLLEDATIRGYDAQKIRQAGRRYGAEVVLIVDGVGAVDRFNRGSAWLYVTLIGAYLASGTESDALFMIDGSLWDVRTDQLYATQQNEGSSKQIGPAMMLEDRAVLKEAKTVALDVFGQRMVGQIRRLGETALRAHEGSR